MASSRGSVGTEVDNVLKGVNVPSGLATKFGLAGTAILAFVAAFGSVLDGFGAEKSEDFATMATAVGIATILGRMLQAAAAMRDAPSPAQNDVSGELDVPEGDISLHPDSGGTGTGGEVAAEAPPVQPPGLRP